MQHTCQRIRGVRVFQAAHAGSSSGQTLSSTAVLEAVHQDLIGGASRVNGGSTVRLQ
jgi:hypothetical protein